MKRNTLIITILCASLLGFLMISESFTEESQSEDVSKSAIVELSDENYASETSKGIVIVNYWSPWCAMCRHSKPMLEEISKEYNGTVKTARINAASNKRFTIEKRISMIPSTLIYKDNKEIVRITGRTTKEELKRIIEQNE